MKNQVYQVISILAILLYFLPIAIVLLKKLWHIKPFLFFALFWMLGGLVNLVDLLPVSIETTANITIIYNSLDIPIVLIIFYMITPVTAIKQIIRIILPLYAGLEIVSLYVYGLQYDSLKYSLGIGLLIVMSIMIWEIIVYLRKISHTGQEKGLLLIKAALLFEYGTYIVIYIFDYYLPGVSSTIDNFIVYYVSSIIGLTLASCGYLVKGVNKQAGPQPQLN